ncbi:MULTISPECIES: cell division protein FtsQ/DivIB [Brevibacterium]|uniref:POTRA domain-containing protein, FtsQ-type n=1 Tax=Brevibacterium linens ATCC 9172 TaxID=1255617 RepID=A0A2H1HHR9_BRELN|nr:MULTISPECIES: FtsQ-type POTRA domain-containing protein [Brevibacterium]KAB1949444.1 FtsQ-type POTRA domain-containing protein [Brevibacterium linens ATCC 9172]SMX62464.1 POTRA domain-containing protein, FtsQ-type [Brevibacterium linens ATCC 9172]
MVPLPPARSGDNSTADLTGVIRARRLKTWRRRLIAIGIVAALIALAAVAWFSPLLTLKKVQVSGSELIDTDTVSEFVLERQGDRPLPQVRPGAVEDSVLGEFPKAEAASVHYAGPRALKIDITDRTPVIAIEDDSGFRLYDSEAVDLGTVDTAPKKLTVLNGGAHQPDRETVAAVIRFMGDLRPELRRQLVTIEAEDAMSLKGRLDTGKQTATVVFGDSSDSSLKVRTAAQLAAEGRTEIDVSVPSVPVTD